MVTEEQKSELRDLVSQVRLRRRVVLGVSQEAANRDLGERGQNFELLIYNGEQNPAWSRTFNNHELFGWMIRIAQYELAPKASVEVVA
jgi:hypothetical protein